MEMCLVGVSARSVEDVARILWDKGVSAGTVSDLNKRAFASVEEWGTRPLTCEYPYVFVDGTYVKRSWGGAYESVAVLVAIGVNSDGFREVIGVAAGHKESEDSWREFLLGQRERGLRGVRMLTGDKSAGMLGALAQAFPDAMYTAISAAFALSAARSRRRRSAPSGTSPWTAWRSTCRTRWCRSAGASP